MTDFSDLVRYVKQNAKTAAEKALLYAGSRPYNADYPSILITYYSLPDYLETFNFAERIHTTPFEHLVRLHKHAADVHQTKLSQTLEEVAAFPSGKALLKEVGTSRRSVRIMPYWHFSKSMPGLEYFNSTPRPVLPGERLGGVTQGHLRNYVDIIKKGLPTDPDVPTSKSGTGKGADVVLYFSTRTWESGTDQGTASTADEVLFHELAHVSRMQRGVMTNKPMTGSGDYGNIEEYFATVLTNIFMSDKGKRNLRGSYGQGEQAQKYKVHRIGGEPILFVVDALPRGWDVLPDPDNFYFMNPQGNSITPAQLMEEFRKTQRQFFDDLASLPDGKPRFNPVRIHHRKDMKVDI